jgi:hypothetical protein
MLMDDPKVVASANLGLKLANAFGVILRRKSQAPTLG